MKTVSTLVAILVMAAAAQSQENATTSERSYFANPAVYQSIDVSKVAKAYLATLCSPNDGVVESALAHVAMIKLAVPACKLPSVIAAVSKIEREAGSDELRYKAFVTKSLLENPKMFSDVAAIEYSEPDQLFAALAEEMAEYYASN